MEALAAVTLGIGVWAAVMATVSAFADGKSLWSRFREKRRAKKLAAAQALSTRNTFSNRNTFFRVPRTIIGMFDADVPPPPPTELPLPLFVFDDSLYATGLETSLTTSPWRIQSEYTRLFNVAGPLFGKGDAVSALQLSDSLARFQQNLVDRIRVTTFTVYMIDLDVSRLTEVPDTCRTDHFSSMGSLFQRVLVARPIAREPRAATVLMATSTIGQVSGSGSGASRCWCLDVSSLPSSFGCVFCGRGNNLLG